jgi:peptide/nickel transport system permease protein
VLGGNLGVSYSTYQPVTSLLGPEVPVTLEIGVISLILTVLAGIPLGVRSALRKDRLFDHLARVSSYTYVAVPNFVLALLCVLIFGLWVRNVWPYQGFVPLSQSIGSNLSHVLLPAVCLALAPIGIVSRATRASMLEVLGSEYVVAARALGVPRREIVWKYALRNALMPVITILGLITGYVLSGAVLIETIFSLHGLGEQLYSSLNYRDYPVVIAIFMLGAVVFVLANLAVDLAYGLIDPRVRAGYAKRSA